MSRVYAVKAGRKTGLFYSWTECSAQVTGFKGAIFKSFTSEEEAKAFLGIESPEKKKEKVNPLASAKKKAKDSMDVYVDGSYSNGRYAWSYVVYKDGVLFYEDYGVGSNDDASLMRNVAGELAAAMRATKWAKANNVTITIHYDYRGIEDWVSGAWRAKNSMTKAYRDYMNQNKEIIQFNKVVGHTGVEGNERADQLAKKALGL